jgi:PST family polysaccharide transporter
MSATSLGGQVARGAFWSYAAYGAGRGVTFVGLATLARLLGPDEFGLFGMAMVLVNLLEVSRDLGLQRALVFLGCAGDAERVRRTGLVLTVGVGLGLGGLVLLAAPLIGHFFGLTEVASLMRPLAVYFVIAGLGTVPDAILLQRLDFRRRFWPELGAPLVRYGVAIGLALGGSGAWALVAGQIAGVVTSVVLSVALCGWWPRVGFDRAIARSLLRFSWQASAVEITAAVLLNLDYLLVGRFLGSAALGLYTLAFRLPDTTLVAIANVSGRLFMPAFVRVKDDPVHLRESFVQALYYLAIVVIPAAAGLWVLAPLLVPLLFGPQWAESVPATRLLVLSSAVLAMLMPVGSLFLAVGRPRLILAAQAVYAAVLLPGLALGAQIDITMAALAHLIGALAYAAAKLTIACRVLGVDWRNMASATLPSVGAASLMALVLLAAVPHQQLPVQISIPLTVLMGAAVYAGGLALLDRNVVRRARGLIARRAEIASYGRARAGQYRERNDYEYKGGNPTAAHRHHRHGAACRPAP